MSQPSATRWLVLAAVGVAQLMVVLDATIVNIALPSAQVDLGFSDDNRQWVVTAYALAFGSLLLIGGRLGDLYGRKQMFVTGLAGFAVASALGGAAGSFTLLVIARAGQGVFAALLAPAALALLSTTFTDPKERGKAFGIFGAVAGAGAGLGLLLGGALTEWLSWRWCMYVNLVFAVPAAIMAMVVIGADTERRKQAVDVPGAVTGTLGLFAVVFGFSSAESRGWDSPVTIASLVAGPLLLLAFVLIESRAAAPLLPLHVVRHATRGGSYFAIAALGIAMFGVLLFLTFYFQQNLGYSPLRAGFAFVPLNLTIIAVSAGAARALLPKFGPRALIVGGLTLGAVGMVLLARIDEGFGYLDVLPALLLIGVCAGLLYTTTYATGTLGVSWGDMGVASAMLNTASQIGGSIGTALLSTVFADAVSDSEAGSMLGAAVDGYASVFWWAAGLTAISAAVAFVLMRSTKAQMAAQFEWAPPAGAAVH
ncbi:EmrB/QacA subfamily drug resistance transporter [Actinoplanes lutulentus]|uniref:EmrB/QacA subfamily drug resistance transporter n=1 Tax=Actinoplanes lutulentus TaxID=1287878 RepID=A0A327Z3I1_9ACTN|nr:MFS transporter [Actinoplanes lutulentus]MBB2948863.1 EmrB/QacA subfamily drug resistance transporter [Actinoplanes lutulentus]RAK29773.1 EmrB/QacA subfamily drug resistance transporter [Actinoplanes lutulentus]